MPSWEKLREIGADVAHHLPGGWTIDDPPPYWLVVITRDDRMVRLLIDDRMIIVAETSNGKPLAPMGSIPANPRQGLPSTMTTFRTRHRDGKKIAELVAQRLGLR